MIKTIPVSYPYKVIHSYFINFNGINDYDEIKRIVLNIVQPTTEKEIQIKKMHILTLLAFSKRKMDVAEFIEMSNRVYPEITYSHLDFVSLLQVTSNNEELCLIAESSIKKIGVGLASFAIYIAAMKLISENLDVFFSLPITYSSASCDIQTPLIRKYFLMGVIEQVVADNPPKEEVDLMALIKDFYIANKDDLVTQRIENVYMFGSISKGEYHGESDIDMVVKFELDISKDDVLRVFELIKNINSREFHRGSDVYEYNEFMESNPHIELYKLF